MDKDTNNEIRDRNKSYYDNAAKTYYLDDDSRSFTKKHLEDVFNAAISNLRPQRMLDIGVGTGLAIEVMNEVMQDEGICFTGCDVSIGMLIASKYRGISAGLVLYDGERLPFSDNAFDMVVLSSVLHHIYDYIPVVKEVIRVLSEGGIVIITQEPNPVINGLLLRFRRLLGLMPEDPIMMVEYHQFMSNGIDSKLLVDLLKSHGLECSLYYSNGPLVDEVSIKLGRWSKAVLSIFTFMRNMFTCLSYSIVGKGGDL